MEESKKSDSQEWVKPKAYKRQKAQKKKQDCVQIVNIDKKKLLDSTKNTRSLYNLGVNTTLRSFTTQTFKKK